jgi:hypothetical protein
MTAQPRSAEDRAAGSGDAAFRTDDRAPVEALVAMIMTD